jgi:hypothetical protein
MYIRRRGYKFATKDDAIWAHRHGVYGYLLHANFQGVHPQMRLFFSKSALHEDDESLAFAVAPQENNPPTPTSPPTFLRPQRLPITLLL